MLRTAWLPYALCAQVIMLGMAWQLSFGAGAAPWLALSSALTLMLLRFLFRRKRAILDTPTSRIASAAQGYVELSGRAQRFGVEPLRSKLTGLPCVWYRYTVDQRRGDRWVRIDQGTSNERILLRDESGDCVMDPESAEVIPSRRDRWSKGDYRFSEELLLEGETLYALGDMGSEGGVADAPARQTLLQGLLTQWKKNQPALLARFDLDGSGHLDATEWQLARSAAAREASAQQDTLRAGTARSLLRRPPDGRPHLISSHPPERLAWRYRTWFHVNVALLVTHGIAWASWLHGLGVQ